ncbi:cysteine synthase family protein [Paludifilum halophilum]|uniref:Pyridoxal-5'-phosphate-dependent protein n=1 Tax=Paludifilum halophilum TaxID=1642702 RepID=A0A235BBE1_9BACL|nr:cysteine synthase family protein [Paludifilum halophilum]OYD09611.1 pyridoxal-5'-phosphate-dependent protein [Paludifilum halophilum]
MLYQNLIQSIGNTPLVCLKKESCSPGNVFAKMELLNPFAMKDRVAKQAILEAKRTGELKEGAPIIESSSGTLALGVAMVGGFYRHEVHIVTDPRIDAITLRKLESMGACIHIVRKMSQHGWQSARLEKLQQLRNQYPNAYWLRQYENPENPKSYKMLAEELLQDLKNIDILVGSVGSGGSLCGTARALKEQGCYPKVVAVDAVGSVLFGQPDKPKRLQGGLGNSLHPPNIDHSIIDEVHWLNDQEAFGATVELARIEKIFAGNSSGSVYAVARWISRQVRPETNIVAIFPDRGDRYCQTIFDESYRLQHEITLPEQLTPQKVSYGTVVDRWSYSRLNQGANHGKYTAVY